MKIENYDQQLIDKLKQLPKVEDHRDKDALFQQISSNLNKNKPRKNFKFAPVFSTLIVVLLIFIIVPVLINLGISETSLNDSADSNSAMEKSGMEMYSTEQSNDKAVSEHDVQLKDSGIESYVLQNIDEDSTIIYGAVTDEQLQSVIPVTIVIPEIVDLNTYYNQLNHYLEETDWGVNQYLFKDVHFDLDLSKHEVLMEVPDEFSIGDGSANAHIFNEILTTMFRPYQIDKVVFDEEIDLGSFGNILESPIQKQAKESYKVFQADEHQRKFLVPIKTEDDATIEEAFEEMKKDQDTFNIYSTIPENVSFSLSTSDQQLFITFEDDEIIEDKQAAIIMIEAILMTAKSFGYELVTLNKLPTDHIGPYDLSDSIEVPKAVNPIYP